MGGERISKATSNSDSANPEPSRRARRPAPSSAWAIQPSLVVGASNDPYEIEADRIARQVTRDLNRAQPTEPLAADADADDPAIRRSTRPAIGPSSAAPQISRIQRRSHGAAIGPEGGAVDGRIESRIRAASGSGRALPNDVGARMQQAFGADFSGVRLHDNKESHDLNRSIQARAFTTRRDIFLGRDAPSLSSARGTELLAHELTHVVQQTGGVHRSLAVRRDDAGAVRRVTAPPDPVLAAKQKREALADHAKDRAALMKIVRDGAKSSDRRTKNACEWILDNRTKLYALNATGDHNERIAHLGLPAATTETWFPKGNGGPGDLQSPVAPYNELDLDDRTNVCVDIDDGPSTNGWNGDGYIAVMMGGGQMKKAEVLTTLRHEVQHDADKNRDKENTAVPVAGDTEAKANKRAVNFEGYKTEYRAYNYEASSYMKLSPTKVVRKYGFKWTERQLEVFEQIFDGYDHTKKYWDDSYRTAAWQLANAGSDEPDVPSSKGNYHDPTISPAAKVSIEARRRALVDYVNPDDEGFNKWDSIRVDDFYRALDAVPPGTSTDTGPPMSALLWKAGLLGKADARYVLEESPDMRKKMHAQLVDQAYVIVYKTLCEVAGVKKATPLTEMGKSDSAHIQAFSDALDAVPVGTSDPADALVKKLRYRTADLTKKEAKQVLGHNSKLLNKIDYRLAGRARTQLLQLLQDCLG